MSERVIEQFQGDYRFLSNFTYFETPMKYDGDKYRTVEHFYVAMKTTNKELRGKISRMRKIGRVKAYGRELEIREDWEDIKLKVMRYALEYKFSDDNEDLRLKLMNTEGMELQEGNYWGDTYWGVCLKTGKGSNLLGSMLMEIREEVIKEDFRDFLIINEHEIRKLEDEYDSNNWRK